MSAASVNRETIRDAFTALCVAAMVPTAVDAVYNYERSVITDKTALMILSSGSRRLPSGVNDVRWRNEFHFEVLSFVRKPNTLSQSGSGADWTEANVEDRLDLIDKYLADVIADNRVNANWSYIEFETEYSVIADGRAGSLQRDQGSVGFKVESRLVTVTYVEK